MSLVPSYVKLGQLWYQGPAIYDETKEWFICFDDEDPPELIVKMPQQLDKVKRMELIMSTLDGAGIKARILVTSISVSHRCFPPDYEGFHQAVSVDLDLYRNIDVTHLKVKHDGISQDLPPMGEFVAYDFERLIA